VGHVEVEWSAFACQPLCRGRGAKFGGPERVAVGLPVVKFRKNAWRVRHATSAGRPRSIKRVSAILRLSGGGGKLF
jgi:hypothetical protein